MNFFIIFLGFSMIFQGIQALKCWVSSSVDNALGSVQETNGVCVWAKDNLGVYYYGMADSIFDAKVNHLTFCDDSDLCNKFENIVAKEEAEKISSGLRGGEIAAIVIGSIVGAAFLIGIGLWRKFRNSKQNDVDEEKMIEKCKQIVEKCKQAAEKRQQTADKGKQTDEKSKQTDDFDKIEVVAEISAEECKQTADTMSQKEEKSSIWKEVSKKAGKAVLSFGNSVATKVAADQVTANLPF